MRLLTKGEDVMAWDYNKEFLNTIKEYCGIPKVKTEIPVQLVLKSFIQDVLNDEYGLINSDNGMKYITIEFPYLTKYAAIDFQSPLQDRSNTQKEVRGKNQTKNIDFLLLQKNKAFFVELKTSSNSTSIGQLDNYINFINNINQNRKRLVDLLTTDIEQVKKSSGAVEKYANLQKLLENSEINLSGINDFEMIYIVPSTTKNKYIGEERIKWLSIRDIAIKKPYKPGDQKYEAWCEVCNILKSIDK